MTDWSTWIYVETYLDCKIYTTNLGTSSNPKWVFGSPCISTWYERKSALKDKIEDLEPEPPADMNLVPIIIDRAAFLYGGD